VKVQGCWKAPFFIDYQRLARMKVWGETFFLFFTHIIFRPLHRDSKESSLFETLPRKAASPQQSPSQLALFSARALFDIFTFKDYDTRRKTDDAAYAGIHTQAATET
jgi:hypothetical protein